MDICSLQILTSIKFPEVTLIKSYLDENGRVEEPGFTYPTPYDDKKIAFYGVYSPVTLGANLIFLSYYEGKNQLFYSPGNTKLKAFRAYFKYDNGLRLPEASTSRLVFDFEETAPTGIADINREPANSDNNVYDLQGRRVEKPAKGLYIINQKKVYIK